MHVALWVFNVKRRDLGEWNTERLKQRNGNDDNSDTRVGERKIGDTIVQCTFSSCSNMYNFPLLQLHG